MDEMVVHGAPRAVRYPGRRDWMHLHGAQGVELDWVSSGGEGLWKYECKAFTEWDGDWS